MTNITNPAGIINQAEESLDVIAARVKVRERSSRRLALEFVVAQAADCTKARKRCGYGQWSVWYISAGLSKTQAWRYLEWAKRSDSERFTEMTEEQRWQAWQLIQTDGRSEEHTTPSTPATTTTIEQPCEIIHRDAGPTTPSISGPQKVITSDINPSGTPGPTTTTEERPRHRTSLPPGITSASASTTVEVPLTYDLGRFGEVLSQRVRGLIASSLPPAQQTLYARLVAMLEAETQRVALEAESQASQPAALPDNA